ncbi:MAG TPA: ATP-binding protein [Bacteroidales bacterium]|nr:ATP-binding protein [Bacteroidales bacterium]
MKSERFLLYSVIIAVMLLVLAVVSNILYFSNFEYRFRTTRFNRILREKEVILAECLESMRPILSGEDHHGSVPENQLFTTAEKNKITILEFFDHRLAFWSDNNFDVPQILDDSLYYRPIIFLQNGWFLPRVTKEGNETIVGLLRIRTDFSLRNDILKSGFEKDYGIPEGVGFSTDRNASEFRVFDSSGRFLFCLLFPEIRQSSSFIFIPLLLWTTFFVFALLLLLQFIKLLVSKKKEYAAILLALFLCAGTYLLLVWYGLPKVFYETELFSRYRFSLNAFIPTLGHLLLLGILGVYFAGILYRYLPLKENADSSNTLHLAATGIFIAAAVMTGLYHNTFRQVILTSNVNFEPFRVLDLTLFSLAGYIALFFLLLIPVLFMLKFLPYVKRLKTGSLLPGVIPGLILLALITGDFSEDLVVVGVFFVLLCLLVMYSSRYRPRIFIMTVLFSVILALYSVYFIINYSEEKTIENVKIQAISFSTENDPQAEQELLDLWPVINSDTVLAEMMKADTFNNSREDVDNIRAYLHDTYFRGYWANFNIDIVLCRNDDPLAVGPGNELFPSCFNFFDERVRRDGHRLTGTDFFFIDNQGGRSYYLGKLTYPSGEYTHALFIELFADLNIFQPGYSALLLDEKYHGYSGLKDYSFAKYLNGEIVLRTGDFPYMKNDAGYIEDVSDYKIFRSEGYKHVLYKNGNSTVIISRPYITTGDVLISFAYLFVLILLLSNLLVLIIRRRLVPGKIFFNFRQKLQLSYIAILLFSFILIGIVVAYLTITQYNTKHYENIKEKLASVYKVLDDKLSMERHIDNTWRNEDYPSLNDLLFDLSNTFNTDINLYDINGKLIATSRPEIFNRNLTSTRINNTAYNILRDLSKSEYYQKEKIGNLEYLSAYAPFFSSGDKPLAFVNLPYFRMQNVLAKEISNLIVAVVNFTLLLILITMSIAVIISDRLTAPLSMLSAGLAAVELGKKTEHLAYAGRDEIGELVRQYNRMVDEIEESAGKLANSEREYAWREMARQIAHEIKNPLTPMKLNVQQLLKSWRDRIPDFDEKIAHFAKNQIEYIDNLSNIATAFSSFAKMPGTKPAEVNLSDQIRITLELFRDTEDVTFEVQWPQVKKVVVFADKEHLNSIFSNLIKNGIQSIPQGRHGVIRVKMEVTRDKVIVSISDNGTGIPKELEKKMFTPNFTTKSSGTGLGLSIVRKYVETANGRIWFDSEDGRGTTFFVELPLKYTVEGH